MSAPLHRMEDSRGNIHELTPGVPSPLARHIFLNGHCLALASVIARRLGTERVLVSYAQDVDYQWDDGADAFITVDVYHSVHVWAIDGEIDDPCTRAWDYDGSHTLDDIHTEIDDGFANCVLEIMTPSEAEERFRHWMVTQDVAAAHPFADLVLAGATS